MKHGAADLGVQIDPLRKIENKRARNAADQRDG
jgi:hypothetical protein